VLLGAALIALARGRASPRRAPIAASLGAALATLGLASSFGHFTGMDSTTFWFRLTSVRLQTGIAFAIAGMGLLGAAWRESVAVRPVMPRWSRSEERRVGKEGRAWWWACHDVKK